MLLRTQPLLKGKPCSFRAQMTFPSSLCYIHYTPASSVSSSSSCLICICCCCSAHNSHTEHCRCTHRRSIVHSSPPSKTRSGPPRKQLVLFIPPAQAKARYPASLGVANPNVTPVISKVLRYDRDAPRIRQRRGAISFPKGTILRYERPSNKTEPQMMAFEQMAVSSILGQQESLGSPVKLSQHRESISNGSHFDERRGSLTLLSQEPLQVQ